jgi:hypothetical protein
VSTGKGYRETDRISTWQQLWDLYQRDEGWGTWIFRGQGLYEWELATSLERAVQGYNIEFSETTRKELGLLRRFKRQLRHFSMHIPEGDDYLEWFSIMQHYGCPTRLLDFTYSFFIGVFFAIADAKIGDTAALWAINRSWLEKRYKSQAPEEVRSLLAGDPHMKGPEITKAILNGHFPSVLNVNPLNLNERLVIQQGCFVVPLDLGLSFMENLRAVVDSGEVESNVLKIPIECNEGFLLEAFLNFHRMNINYAGLFPGIDGFARYLRMLLPLPEGFLAIDKEEY